MDAVRPVESTATPPILGADYRPPSPPKSVSPALLQRHQVKSEPVSGGHNIAIRDSLTRAQAAMTVEGRPLNPSRFVVVVIKVGSGAKALAQKVKPSDRLISLARNVAFSARTLLWESAFVAQILKATLILRILLVPGALIETGEQIKAGFDAKTGEERVDAFFGAITAFKTAPLNTALFLAGLKAVGLVAGVAISIVALKIITLVLAVGVLIANARGWYQSAQLLTKFQYDYCLDRVVPEVKREHLHQAFEKLEAEKVSFWKKHFKINRKPDSKVNAVFTQAMEDLKADKEFAVSRGQRIMENLKGRINTKIWSHRLTILAELVAAAGIIVLLVVSPVCPVGFALLAVAGIIALAKVAYEQDQKAYYDEELDQIRLEQLGTKKARAPPKITPAAPPISPPALSLLAQAAEDERKRRQHKEEQRHKGT